MSTRASAYGPPLHIHFKEHEEGTVIAGTLAAEVDGVQVRVEQGGLVRLPMDRLLSAIFDVINSGPARRPPVFYMAHLLWRHRKTQTLLIAPQWIQAMLFPTIVLVGTLLGRYSIPPYRLARRVSASPNRSRVKPILSMIPRNRLHILRF